MNNFNELDPMAMAGAPILGQRRGPTKAEQKKMLHAQFLMAFLNVSGTAISSMLESGAEANQASADFAKEVTKEILRISEASADEFDDPTQRKLRNQLAAQLVFSDLRGGNNADAKDLVKGCFKLATDLVLSAEAFADEGVDNEDVADSPLVLPS